MAARRGKISVYGPKTRALQRRLSFEAFGLSYKDAKVYRYLGPVDDEGIDNIQCKVFYEVPDRAYDTAPVDIPIGMEPLPEMKTDFSRFGLINPLSDETTFRVHIDDFDTIGRDLIVGDVFEMPFFSDKGKALYEVTDVDLKSSYEKFIAIIHAVPLGDSRTNASLDSVVNRDDGAIVDIMRQEAEEQYNENVPTEELSYDRNEVQTDSEVDPRNKTQKSFLDDPDAEF